jgi:shikimate dehydrogenase
VRDPARTYCVIGDPIGHSLSPVIHAAVFESLGVPAAYEAVRVPPADLAGFVEDARREGRPGFNVTIPHKRAVMPLLDEIDAAASGIGAVNTVALRGGRLAGFNTDVDGCRSALDRGGWTPAAPGGAVMLGAGGAARAAVASLSAAGLASLSVFEIDRSRAESLRTGLAVPLGMELEILDSRESLEAAVRGAGLLINASPAGMWPKTDDTPLPDSGWLSPAALVFDMVPNPVETRLLREARTRGARTVPGLVMLVAQALAADAIWLDRPVPEALFDAAMTRCIQHLEDHGRTADSHGR